VINSALPTTQCLTLTACPECGGALQILPNKTPKFTPEYQQAMITQLRDLRVDDQIGCKIANMPNVRVSLEASDVLQEGLDVIDPIKLDAQAQFIQSIGNPMLFFHHYSNPLSKSDLFNNSQDIDWFANYCAQVIKKSPQVTHVCPISQPVGFAFRVTSQSLPPFTITTDKKKYLQNIADAQAAAAKAMKAVKPDVKVLMSHQWKLMKPKHSYLDPRYYLEAGVCKIAHSMYNQAFVNLMKPHIDLFDGIALSLYPPVYFNGWKPEADNCGGIIDEKSALETIVEVRKAFPDKDIYIVETGCNTQDPAKKIEFIDMTLRVCQAARDQGIPVKSVYFWGLTNDPNFYSEWNMAPGSTNFGPFDKLELENPTRSINAAGKHMQKILKQDATV
ncbi:hypothetical protein KBD08_04220, partial [Candidatus Babeliales bacterium]|nr:hypothetical protein [Candidatus Babeliales bacterium]